MLGEWAFQDGSGRRGTCRQPRPHTALASSPSQKPSMALFHVSETQESHGLAGATIAAWCGGRPSAQSARHALPCLFAILAVWVAGTGCGDEPSEATAIVVARIDGEPIYRATYNEVLGRAGYDAATAPLERQQIAARVIEELINQNLIDQLLAEKGVKVSDSEIDAMIEKLASQLAARQQSLSSFLRDSGRDEKLLRKQFTTELGLNKLLLPQMTEQGLKAFFEERRQEFDGTRLRISHLVLRPDSAAGGDAERVLLDRAAEIKREIIETPLTFAEAVGRYSVGQSRLRGGDLGFIPRHGFANEVFAAAAFRLSRDEISDPVLTPFGVHLITVTDTEPGRGSFGSARAEVTKLLASEKLREMLQEKRRQADIVFAPGIPHFVNAIGSQAGRPTVVVEPGNGGNGGK
jgi:parvulin-like peptidyl-prolyl isomerase